MSCSYKIRLGLGRLLRTGLASIGFSLSLSAPAQAQNGNGSAADARAREVEQQMTDDERLALVYSLMPVVIAKGANRRDPRVPAHIKPTAGWVKGVPRLGIPDLLLTDLGLGITKPNGGRNGDPATALPSAQALGATFNPALARESGALAAREARARGFNVLLGGAINLARDPRHGRNFEYFSEDPLLSAIMGAESVNGTQSEGVIGLLRHVSLNSHETNKSQLDAQIDQAAHREAELLAFEIAIERASPGALMCASNKVNGAHACSNDPILNGVIKDAFGYKGWIMSDWRAVHGWEDALKGLDQHSGVQLDEQEWFVAPLRDAYGQGRLPRDRLSDMVRRILRSIYAVGVDSWAGTAPPNVNLAAHHKTALEIARQGIVLLKNGGLLPLRPSIKRIAVIGGSAPSGVHSAGAAPVAPMGGVATSIPLVGDRRLGAGRAPALIAPGPLQELKKRLATAEFIYSAGEYPNEAAAAARRADIVIVFATKLESEGFDSPDLALPNGQNEVIDAVATANPRTVVVLQTGNAVAMPWRDKVNAIVEAWYPGQAGGQAIAEVLTGEVNPSGRLPLSFVAGVEQTPHPRLAGFGDRVGTPLTLRYHEGAEVGYRWLARTKAIPLFPFGHGLSYTTFDYGAPDVRAGETISVRFTVRNSGERDGADVPQLYLISAAGHRRMRLLGFERLELVRGETRTVTLTADPRLLGRYDSSARQWRIMPGTYKVALGHSSGELVHTATVTVSARMFGK